MTNLQPRRVDQLRAIPLFQACCEADLLRLDELIDEIDVEPGEVVQHAGRSSGHVFAIADGLATTDGDGDAPAELGPGDAFGSIGPTPTTPLPAVVATTPMRLFVLDAERLRTVVDLADLAQRVLDRPPEPLSPDGPSSLTTAWEAP